MTPLTKETARVGMSVQIAADADTRPGEKGVLYGANAGDISPLGVIFLDERIRWYKEGYVLSLETPELNDLGQPYDTWVPLTDELHEKLLEASEKWLDANKFYMRNGNVLTNFLSDATHVCFSKLPPLPPMPHDESKLSADELAEIAAEALKTIRAFGLTGEKELAQEKAIKAYKASKK